GSLCGVASVSGWTSPPPAGGGNPRNLHPLRSRRPYFEQRNFTGGDIARFLSSTQKPQTDLGTILNFQAAKANAQRSLCNASGTLP
ncbi:hypothetical protein LEMLEM_LOCUS8842, partial [Lemmus lemmus]